MKDYVLFSLVMLALGFRAGEVEEWQENSLDYTRESKCMVFNIKVPMQYAAVNEKKLEKFIRSKASEICGKDIFKNVTIKISYYTTHKVYSQIKF